jgi:hypothetical protein
MENQIQNPEALAIVELEDRFETTVAALDAARCSDNKVTVSAV